MQIQVKDSDWYRDAFNMPNRVIVYIGTTKAEFEEDQRRRHEKYKEAQEMGYSGFDEIDVTDDREEADVA